MRAAAPCRLWRGVGEVSSRSLGCVVAGYVGHRSGVPRLEREMEEMRKMAEDGEALGSSATVRANSNAL